MAALKKLDEVEQRVDRLLWDLGRLEGVLQVGHDVVLVFGFQLQPARYERLVGLCE